MIIGFVVTKMLKTCECTACLPLSDRHLVRHHKQVPGALIVTASGRFTMMDHFR